MSTSPSSSLPELEAAAAWKQEVNERLAAHRTRRPRRGEEHPTLPGMDAQNTSDAGDPLKSRIAAKVAARYAQAPTYSEMLVAEAQNAAAAAAAAAKAANQAQAAAQAILTGLDLREHPEHDVHRVTQSESEPAAALGDAASARGEHWRSPDTQTENGKETRRSETRPAESRHRESRDAEWLGTRREPWQDAIPSASAAQVSSAGVPSTQPASSAAKSRSPEGEAYTAHETRPPSELRITLAEQAIEYDATPPQGIPANLIEFPRELFATRRARPRLAESPMRDESGADSGRPQLRIFEVEHESISTVPTVEHMGTEWSSIRLGAHPVSEVETELDVRQHKAVRSGREYQPHAANSAHVAHASHLDLPLQTASLEDRAMAAVVDVVLVTAAFLLYLLAFAACTSHLPAGKPALIGAALSFFAMAIGYQLLFFKYAESTPGMRYAKIALCTFDDENPTRRQMRTRVATMLLSLCPLGLGCAWVFFDEDHLSWHDRITRTYQRSYR